MIERPLGGATAPSEDADLDANDDPDETIEPRTVTITGYGPRYRNGVL